MVPDEMSERKERWRGRRRERTREREKGTRVCAREQLGATNERVRERQPRPSAPLGQAPEATDTGKLGRHILGPDPFAVST